MFGPNFSTRQKFLTLTIVNLPKIDYISCDRQCALMFHKIVIFNSTIYINFFLSHLVK